MIGFKQAATLTVTLTRPGCQPVEGPLQAPPFGWWRQFQERFQHPQPHPRPVGGPTVTTDDPDKAKEYALHVALLLSGKVLAMAGGLDRVYPDPLPKDRAQLVALAGEIAAEYNAANLRESEVDALATAAFKLIMGDLPDLAAARESGNDSPRRGA